MTGALATDRVLVAGALHAAQPPHDRVERDDRHRRAPAALDAHPLLNFRLEHLGLSVTHGDMVPRRGGPRPRRRLRRPPRPAPHGGSALREQPPVSDPAVTVTASANERDTLREAMAMPITTTMTTAAISAMTGGLLPLRGFPPAVVLDEPEQLALLGRPTAIRVPERRWRAWLDDPMTVARFDAKRYRRPGDRCWVWMGAVSSTGHGCFRAASLPGPTRRGTVSAHLFAYQLAYGVIPRLGWSDTDDEVICHQCDFAACTNPNHMRLGTHATNRYEYHARRGNLASPLADVRGAAGRARAIATAVRMGLAHDESATTIERRISDAERAGRPWTLW